MKERHLINRKGLVSSSGRRSSRFANRGSKDKDYSQYPKNSLAWTDLFKINVILIGIFGSSWLLVWAVEAFWLPLGNFSVILYVGVLLLELGFLLKIIQWCLAPYLAHETAISLEDDYKMRLALQQGAIRRTAQKSRKPEKYAASLRADAPARPFCATSERSSLSNDQYPI